MDLLLCILPRVAAASDICFWWAQAGWRFALLQGPASLMQLAACLKYACLSSERSHHLSICGNLSSSLAGVSLLVRASLWEQGLRLSTSVWISSISTSVLHDHAHCSELLGVFCKSLLAFYHKTGWGFWPQQQAAHIIAIISPFQHSCWPKFSTAQHTGRKDAVELPLSNRQAQQQALGC